MRPLKSPLLDLVVVGDRIYRDGEFNSGWFAVRGGRIAGRGEGTPPAARETLDFRGSTIVPGLVDLHVHGSGGSDSSSDEPEEVGKMARALARLGTTAFQATLYPAPVERLTKRLQALGARSAGPSEARLLGAHLEGPFLNVARAGALDPRCLFPPSPGDVRRLIEAGEGVLRTITVAPELRRAAEAIREFAAAGVRVSLGHSDATAEQARGAAAAGAKGVTHLFNAMRPFHHREAGLAGRALLEPELLCELIGDLGHVGPEAVELALRAKGLDGLCLVSDGLRGTGTKARAFSAGGRRHVVRGGLAFAGRGRISGSCVSLREGVARLVAAGILSLADAVRLASTNPARAAGVADRHGHLGLGAAADFLVLGPSGALKRAFLGGRPVDSPGSPSPG